MKKQSTKEIILQASFDLFKEKGYDSVTLKEICDQCQLTKTAFYYHFSSKENLLIHYYDSVIDKISNKSIAFVNAQNYWEQIIICFDELLQADLELGPDLTSQLFITNLREDKGTFNFNPVLTDMCLILIKKAQDAGQILNQKAPNELYQAAAFLFTGYETMWCIKKGKFDRKQIMRQSLETIFETAPEFCLKNRIDPNQIFLI